jgi:hypothetical protein
VSLRASVGGRVVSSVNCSFSRARAVVAAIADYSALFRVPCTILPALCQIEREA